jgi:hypothetical protein
VGGPIPWYSDCAVPRGRKDCGPLENLDLALDLTHAYAMFSGETGNVQSTKNSMRASFLVLSSGPYLSAGTRTQTAMATASGTPALCPATKSPGRH